MSFMGRFVLLSLVPLLLHPVLLRAQAVHTRDGTSVEGTSGPATADPKHPDLSAAAKEVIRQTNEFRKAEKRQIVQVNDKLTATARDFANFMAETDKYGHEADGKRPADRAKEHGYDYCLIEENIAYVFNSAGFSTEELAMKFFEGWKQSPGHRRNMLDPDVTETGVAIARSPKSGYYYAVQMFGRPKSQSIAFRIANESGATVHYTIGNEKFDLEPRYVRTHERCRPEEVHFDWPKGGEPAIVKPRNGERYDIVRDGENFRVKQAASATR